MGIDERRQRLDRKLEEVLGPEEAHTLIEDVRTMSHEHELLRRDMQVMFAELRAELLEKMNDQTKTLFRTFVITNATLVLAVAVLAFGAARLT